MQNNNFIIHILNTLLNSSLFLKLSCVYYICQVMTNGDNYGRTSVLYYADRLIECLVCGCVWTN